MIQKRSSDTDAFGAVDAFCGAGGLSLGLLRAGFNVIAAFDSNEKAITTYRSNLGDHAVVADALEVTSQSLFQATNQRPREVFLVAGGPPCQGFSVQRKRREAGEDPRNTLPAEFLRLVRELKAPFFVFENVPGIRSRHGEKILRAFLHEAEEAGFVCHCRVLDAVNYGVPQFRKRLFVVGELSSNGDTWFEFPDATSSPEDLETTVGHALTGIPSPPEDFSPHPAVPNHKRTRLSDLNLKRLSLVPQGGGMEDLPPELRVQCHRNGADRIGHRYVYGRLHWERPSATITARFDSFTRGKFGHPLEIRNITLREGARLQSFPDEFVFHGGQEEIAAQIGNAVPPKLAEVLGTAIRDALVRRQRGDPPLSTSPKFRQASLFELD